MLSMKQPFEPAALRSSYLLLLLLLSSLVQVWGFNSTRLTSTVQWDPYSLLIQGQRVFILAAEFHPWRTVNPNLWRDVFEKIKDNGYNTVSFYTHWGIHYPFPGVNGDAGDFTAGTYRDIQRFIDEGKRAGLWMIARPGPYINSETTGGGIPGWASTNAGALRTNAADYTAAWTPYITQMAKLVAKNQISQGGPIILVQAENEFSEGTTRSPYMQATENTYRNNGVVIPFIHNDKLPHTTHNFSPDTDTTPGNGAVNIYCGDSYPQGKTAWAQVQSVYRSDHVANARDNPLCLAEVCRNAVCAIRRADKNDGLLVRGGSLPGWAGAPMGGTGCEEFTDDLFNADYENVFYKENYAQTAKMLSIYMVYGGTNWGNTAEPTVYTSYDFGAGINENRVLTPKMAEMRLQGSFLRVSRDLFKADYIGNGTGYTTNADLYTQESRNKDTNAGFYFVRHNDSTSTTVSTTQLRVNTSIGQLTIPRTGTLTIQGIEHNIIVTDYVFGLSKTKILYSTSEIMTWTTIGNVDYVIVYAMAGQAGEIAFQFQQQPMVDFKGFTGITSSYSSGTITVNYSFTTGQSQFVRIGTSVVLAIMEKSAALTWHAALIPGTGNFGNYFSIGTNTTVLVGGPYVIRAANISGSQVNLFGDLNGTTTIEVFPPPAVSQVAWNGAVVNSTQTLYGSLKSVVNGLQAPVLPRLGPWKVMGALPEVNVSFDDSSFTTANQMTTNFTALPPLTAGPVLYSQQYGFFGGIQLYRGHFKGTGQETSFNLTVQGGFAFGYSAFLNSVFLGSSQGNATVSLTTATWSIPKGTLHVGSDNVLTVVMDHMGMVETSTNNGKEPRGIRGVSIIGGSTKFSSWKMQGNLGGNAHNPDLFRGHLNEGGLYAERIGAHLPGFDDSTWKQTSTLSVGGAGINFFRTNFSLALPAEDQSDVPIRLSFTPGAVTSNYRVKIYLNGWTLGEYVNNLGPQTIFVLPSGVIQRNAPNTLALAVWSLDKSGAVANVQLISDGSFSSSNDFGDWTDAPNWAAQKGTRPTGVNQSPM